MAAFSRIQSLLQKAHLPSIDVRVACNTRLRYDYMLQLLKGYLRYIFFFFFCNKDALDV